MTTSRPKRKSRNRADGKANRSPTAKPQINPLLAILGIGGVLLAVIGWQQYTAPENQYYRQKQAEARKIKADSMTEQAKAEAEAIARADEIEKAHHRYRSGCTMLTGANLGADGFEFQVIAITAGTPYYDANTGAVLAEGAIICDDRFGTAVIGPAGLATDFARASDADLVNQRFADQLGWNPHARRSLVGELSPDAPIVSSDGYQDFSQTGAVPPVAPNSSQPFTGQ